MVQTDQKYADKTNNKRKKFTFFFFVFISLLVFLLFILVLYSSLNVMESQIVMFSQWN